MKKPAGKGKRTVCVLWLCSNAGTWKIDKAAPVAGYPRVREYANRIWKASELGSHWQWGKNIAAVAEGEDQNEKAQAQEA